MSAAAWRKSLFQPNWGVNFTNNKISRLIEIDGWGIRMTLYIAIGALAGGLLGLRFAVAALGPAIVIVAAITALSEVEGGVHAGELTFSLIAALAAVQLGYLAGCVV